MKFLVFGLILTFFSACQPLEEQPDTKAKIEHHITSNTIRWLKANKELYACGFGGQEHDKIEMLALSFSYYKSIDSIEQGRELLMSAIQQFVGEINRETRFHKYLYKSPFPSEGVEIRIFVETLNGAPPPRDQIIVLSFTDGLLNYKTGTENAYGHRTIHKETYKEALAKLKETGKEVLYE